jgi:hypothetical protein
MQPHVAHEVVFVESRSRACDAGFAHRGREHEVAGVRVAHGALHRGEVRAEAVVRPLVETDLPHRRPLVVQRVEVEHVRIAARRAPEPHVRRIVDVVEDTRSRVDAAMDRVVPEIRDHLAVAELRIGAVVLVAGNPRIRQQRAVRDQVHGAGALFASHATPIRRALPKGVAERRLEKDRLRRRRAARGQDYREG